MTLTMAETRPRIMVVEDEVLVSMFLEDALDMIGCIVAGAVARVEDALALLNRDPIDAAVLDVNLGHGRESYPVADALIARGIPFAFATGFGANGIREDYKDWPVLAKPFSEQQLECVLQALLNRY
jgi:DNA-binding response OmpR family regulator